MSGCTEDEVTAMVAAFGDGKPTEAAAMVALLCAKIGDAAASAVAASASAVEAALLAANATLLAEDATLLAEDAASAAAGAASAAAGAADGAAAIGGDVDGMFMLSNAYLVFFMQVRPCMPIAASLRWLRERTPWSVCSQGVGSCEGVRIGDCPWV